MSVEILKIDGVLVIMPEIYHACSLDVYEEITGIFLGLLLDVHAVDKQYDVLRLPLKETLHYGSTFTGEDRFPAVGQSGKYIDLRLEWFYFNGGKQKKRVAWTTHEKWKEIVTDRQLKPF